MNILLNKVITGFRSNFKLRTKLLISHMTLIIIPTLVLTFFLYNKLYDIIVTDSVLSEQALTEQTTSTIEATLAQITSASHSVAENAFLSDLVSVTKDQVGDYSVPQERTDEFCQYVQTLVDSSVITSIQIYVDEGFQKMIPEDNGSGEEVIRSAADAYGTYWYGIFESKSIDNLLCPSLYLSPTERKVNGELAYISRINFRQDSGDYAAFVVVYFSQDKIDQILKQNISISKSASYIINSRDALVSASNKTLSGAYFMSNNELESTIGNAKKYSTKTYLGESYYVGYYNIGDTDWRLVSILPVVDLIKKGKLIVYLFVGFYLVFSLLAFVLAMLLSNSIVKRVSAVIEQMKSVKHGAPIPIEVKEQSKDEIGSLVDTYNFMSDEINQLLENQSKASEELRISEFKALQSQINPHFLYNSLDMINWLSQSGKPDEVTNAVQALAKFYKLTLSKRNTNATIEKELEHVALYCQLQNMRYENRIEFMVDVSEALMDYEIPKLTLQPIVENSILHGIMEKENKKGTIIITGWKEDDVITLVVSDDGVGMKEEEVNHILKGEYKKNTGSNIGVDNTNSRLKLLYGDEYGLSYHSVPGVGTEVEIRFPAMISSR
jgi:two-component system sensor histidine kinase YesM